MAKGFLFGFALALNVAAPVAAQKALSPMQGAFGNTILSVQPEGTTTKTYVDPDGTYRSVTDGVETRGTWTIKSGMICYSAEGTAAPLCAIGANKKVGSKWKVFRDDDRAVTVSIVAGR